MALLIQAGLAIFMTIAGAPSVAQISASSSLVFRQISIEPDCNIRFFEPHNGRATPLSLSDLKLNWICASSDDSRVGFHGTAMLNPHAKKWTLDWSLIIGNADTRREERWLYRWFDRNYRIFQLNSPNFNGYAIIDSTQTEAGSIPTEFDNKAQNSGPVLLSFCLVRPPKALCGNGHLGQKHDSSDADLSSYALEVLRNIEFIE